MWCDLTMWTPRLSACCHITDHQPHVLVVDDDLAIREVISSYLESHNLRISLAADGRAMKRALTDRTVDLIVLDLKLADEDELESMRGTGAQADRRRVPHLIGSPFIPKPLFVPTQAFSRGLCISSSCDGNVLRAQ
jgi:CheY-like chemotaxis protein